jgi:site-specific DNA-methyltransferase (adenine-specific)
MQVILKSSILPFVEQVYNEDILDLLKRLPDNSIDCIYADPDYNAGVKYNKKSYQRPFKSYIAWCVLWAQECKRVLKDDGNFFIINYPKNNAHLRVNYLDGEFQEVNEYVWVYNTNIGHSKHKFTTAHRSILHCTKSVNNKFYKDNVAVEYKNPTDRRIMELLRQGKKGRMPYSWFYFDLVKNVSRSKTFHSCQIPEKLSRTLISSCTKQNDIVLILFGGSGSEIVECRRLHRHFISAELDRKYHDLILKRLQSDGAIPDTYRLYGRTTISTADSSGESDLL